MAQEEVRGVDEPGASQNGGHQVFAGGVIPRTWFASAREENDCVHAVAQVVCGNPMATAYPAECETAYAAPMSHEFLSDMLGSTRSTVSLTAAAPKREGCIEYSQGSVRILKRRELEKHSCECYRVIRDHLENNAEYDSGLTA